jgi:hypothetical protein
MQEVYSFLIHSQRCAQQAVNEGNKRIRTHALLAQSRRLTGVFVHHPQPEPARGLEKSGSFVRPEDVTFLESCHIKWNEIVIGM